jgi:hypothetical protein
VSSESNEEALAGGNINPRVVRVGDNVQRAGGPWTATVHRFLCYLRAAGFVDGPRPVSIEDDGREVLRFIRGMALLATDAVALSLGELTAIGALCGRFHRASLSYLGSESDRAGPHFTVSHCRDRALIAVSWAERVGVDVDCVRPISNVSGVAGHVASADEVALIRWSPEPGPGVGISSALGLQGGLCEGDGGRPPLR